jgi:hypothetical protein
MTNETDRTEAARASEEARLDALFSEARAVQPGSDLTARVLADARAIQAEATAADAPAFGWRLRLPRPPAFIAALGGWGGLGGVTAAGLVGLAVGFWSPETVEALGGGQLPFPSPAGDILTPDLSGLAVVIDDV